MTWQETTRIGPSHDDVNTSLETVTELRMLCERLARALRPAPSSAVTYRPEAMISPRRVVALWPLSLKMYLLMTGSLEIWGIPSSEIEAFRAQQYITDRVPKYTRGTM